MKPFELVKNASGTRWERREMGEAHYLRLRSKGKMVALAACMKKMLMIVYGVLKHQKPFNPAWQSNLNPTPLLRKQKPAGTKKRQGLPLTT